MSTLRVPTIEKNNDERKKEFYRRRVANKQRDQLIAQSRVNIIHHYDCYQNIPNSNINRLKRKAHPVSDLPKEKLQYLNDSLDFELVDDFQSLFDFVKYFEEQVDIRNETDFIETPKLVGELTKVFNLDYINQYWKNGNCSIDKSQVKSLQFSACRILDYFLNEEFEFDTKLFQSNIIHDLVELIDVEDELLTCAVLDLLKQILIVQISLCTSDALAKVVELSIATIQNSMYEINDRALMVLYFYDNIDFKSDKGDVLLKYAQKKVEESVKNDELVMISLELLSKYAIYCLENNPKGIRQALYDNLLKRIIEIIYKSEFGDFKDPAFSVFKLYFKTATTTDIEAICALNISSTFQFEWEHGGLCRKDDILEIFTDIMKYDVGIQLIIESNILDLCTQSQPSQFFKMEIIFEILLHIAKNGKRNHIVAILEMIDFFSFLVISYQIGYEIVEVIKIYLEAFKKENVIVSNTNEKHIETLETILSNE